MRLSKWWSLPLMSAMLTGVVIARAADKKPSTQPTEEKEKVSSGKWGFAPYNKLSNVTDDQKLKISEIHKKAIDQIKAIEDKEDEDVLPLLTTEQKDELEKMKADKKAKAAEKRGSKKDSEDDKDKK